MFKLISLRCVGFKRLNIPEPIDLPDGRLLIYGRNESGKSTIMEAIHYGIYGLPLRPSRKASNDDLINYGQSQAVVELRFSIDDSSYTTRRILRRRGTNTHELIIERTDGKREHVTGARKVDAVITQELHGIDSDALLNSCIVEQKELGKLESASRSDRIHAMSSLLNLGAFFEAQQALNKAMNELERANLETTNRLQKAELSKKLCDDAALKLEQAQTRMREIDGLLASDRKRVDELDGILSIIDKMKKLDAEIKERRASLQGIKRELDRVNTSLDEASKAQETAKRIEEELPTARARLEEARVKVNALDDLLRLQNRLGNAQKEAERAKERLEDAKKRLDEALAAKSRLENLEIQVQELEPARKAQELLPRIEELIETVSSARSEAERLEKDVRDLESRLESLKDLEARINQQEQQERDLQRTRSSVSRKRSVGLAITVLGLVASVASLTSLYFLAIGLPLILMGLLLVMRNSPAEIDSKLAEIRVRREEYLGDKARIAEYTRQMEEARKAKEQQEERAKNSNRELLEVVSQLPSRPREYGKVFEKADQPRTRLMNSVREAVQQDLQSLTRLSTERDEARKVAAQLDEFREAALGQESKLREVLETIRSLEESKHAIEEREKISVDQEQELRSSRDTLQSTVQGLEIRLKNSREQSSRKGKLEAESRSLQESVQTIEKEIEDRIKERTRVREETDVDLDKEEGLRSERDKLNGEIGSLDREMNERRADVEESKKTIEENKEMRDEYPSLVEQNDKERFEMESMRRGIKLLEATRDGIVAGVKGHIEAHMMRFLPALTAQRYSMAKIDENDYRIEVYDKEARRWRGKGVFSGATQDQFSLAMRLAFALSTIPSSRGARPGFIFLDEPLSGFDSQRRDGLLNLLRGELSEYFDQIIIISHLEQLRDEFPNQIQVEAGQVTREELGG